MLTVPQYKERLWRRWYRTLDYASMAISVMVIYSVFLIADVLVIKLVEWLLRGDFAQTPALGIGFNAAKVGLASLTIILCVIHGATLAWERFWLDRRLALGEKPRD